MGDYQPTTIEPEKGVEQVSVDTTPPSDNEANLLSPFRGWFGLELPTADQESDMKYIMDFFVNHNIKEIPEMLINLNHISRKLGPIEIGLSRLKAIKTYLQTENQIEGLSRFKQSMEQ